MSATAQKQEKSSQREEQKMRGVKKNNSVLVPLGTETVQAHTDDTVSNDVVAEQHERDVEAAAAAEEAAAGEEERKAGAGDGDDGEEEEEEDEEQEVDDDNDNDDDQIDAEAEKPKLPEGFYELEAVRKRRTRKGRPQYLIKWKGWPESANTWEPMENLMACTEVIAAFDESFKSPKGGSKRKRKQKRKAPRTQIKRKKQQCSPGAHTYDVQTVQVPFEEPMPSPPLAGLDDTNHVDSNGGDLNNVIDNNVMGDNVSKLDSSLEEIKEPSELDLNLSELNGVMEINESCVDKLGDGLTIGSVQSGRVTGAKKRKSYCVRRFRPETASGVRDDAQDGAASAASTPSIKIVQEGVHNFECVENDLGCRIKCDDSKDEYTITHIIKPMSYSPFVSNDVEDVLVTFLAKRSDGKNVTVDSMYLKRTNPLLLANFYEQHLRFNPSVELDAMKKE